MNPTAEIALLLLELQAHEAEGLARLTPRQRALLEQLRRDAARN
jgi:hypothetical protein